MAENAAQALNLPNSVLKTIPQLPPPPGADHGFFHHNTKTSVEVTLVSVFLGLASVFFLARVYTKFAITHKATWDDLTCFLGLLCSIGAFTGFVWSTAYGPNGKHGWNISLADAFSYSDSIGTYLQLVFIAPALGFIKVSFFLFYYQIFWPMRWLRISVSVGASITAAFYGSIMIAFFALATPKPDETWKFQIISPNQVKSQGLEFPLATVGLAIDVSLLILPIRGVMQLQMGKKQRIGVLMVFATGVLACVASSLSIYFRKVQAESKDVFWTICDVELMQIIEVYVGICCVCMPLVAKMLSHHASALTFRHSRISSLRETLKIRSTKDIELSDQKAQISDSKASTEDTRQSSSRSNLALSKH